MYRANCSLPTPVSPSSRTVVSRVATFWARASTSSVRGSAATMRETNLWLRCKNSISERRRSSLS